MDIFVGNFPFNTTEDELKNVFSEYGNVDRIHVATDRDTGRARGFAFVTMSNDQEAKAAIEGLDGYDMDGRPLRVNEARPREERPRRSSGGVAAATVVVAVIAAATAAAATVVAAAAAVAATAAAAATVVAVIAAATAAAATATERTLA